MKNPFGNRARLLGGAVIGRSDHLSAVYCNLGSLALVEKSELFLAPNAFEVGNNKVRNAIGEEDAGHWTIQGYTKRSRV